MEKIVSLIHTTSSRFKASDIIYGPINEKITPTFLELIPGSDDDIAFSTRAFFFIQSIPADTSSVLTLLVRLLSLLHFRYLLLNLPFYLGATHFDTSYYPFLVLDLELVIAFENLTYIKLKK